MSRISWVNRSNIIDFYGQDCVVLIMLDKSRTHHSDNYRSLRFGHHGTVFKTLRHRTTPEKHLSNKFCQRNFAVVQGERPKPPNDPNRVPNQQLVSQASESERNKGLVE